LSVIDVYKLLLVLILKQYDTILVYQMNNNYLLHNPLIFSGGDLHNS